MPDTAEHPTLPLRRLAHGRTGDKGNRSNISVIAWRAEFYPLLVEQVTEQAVLALFEHRRPGHVVRYLLPRLGAMNFVIDDVLDGGVNDSLNLDAHGKALSFLLLSMPVRVPRELLALVAGPVVPSTTAAFMTSRQDRGRQDRPTKPRHTT